MSQPLALGHEAIHETVVEILQNEKRGAILDVPAGEGAVALRLKNLGFDVICSDLYTEIFNLPGTEIRRGNMDETLPFDDESFDYAVCVEGLEHIENPANAIREFARLLKKDGMLIISVPNIMNIEERLKWLFFGYTSHFKPISEDVLNSIPEYAKGMDEIALHVNPIGYSEVRFLLEKNGFKLEKVFLDKRKKNIWVYYPLTTLIKILALFNSEKKRRARWSDELNSNEVLLGGNTLIFKAVLEERKS